MEIAMAIQPLDSMTERLDGLERDNRRLRFLAALTLGVAFLTSAAGLLLRGPAKRTIDAEKLVIRDKAGRIRGTFGLAADGLPGLILFDERGNEQIVLNVPSDGNSSLTFSDKGDARLMLNSSFDGSSSLRFMDKHEQSTSTMFMGQDSTAGLMMMNGKQGLTMGVQSDGRSAVFTTGQDGLENGRVGAPDVSAGSLGFGPTPGLTAGPNSTAISRPVPTAAVVAPVRTTISARFTTPSQRRALPN
jgi:hypothetical protein